MKFHFANSADPLKEGTDIQALCGEMVPKARFSASWDFNDCIGMVEPKWGKECRKCHKVAEFKGRFVYVLCSGQESMTE